MNVKSYKELLVWQKAVELTAETYKVTESYPKSELYGLTSQTRKSSVSAASNIAEGWTRQHSQEYLQFLNVALGSAAELETQLIIANRLGFLPGTEFERVTSTNTEVMKMLYTIIARLKVNDSKGVKSSR